MIWIDSVADLEFFNPNPVFGCYADPLFTPQDLLLQARYNAPLSLTATTLYDINILKPDGTLIEALTTRDVHFDVFFGQYTLNGITYNYTNIRCNNYTTGMLANGCFCLEFKLYDSTGYVYFDKFTQKYNVNNAMVPPSGATISGAASEITLCGSEPAANNCNTPYVKFVAIFDCIDTFSGDFYGNATLVIGGYGIYPFPFVKLSNIAARLRILPNQIKRTISINCRTQKTEITPKLTLDGVVPFPVWKMQEIEGMMLANHLFCDGTEYQCDSATPFVQVGKLPQQCSYVYKFNLPLQQCYQWQVFGCTSVCESQSWYYVIPF